MIPLWTLPPILNRSDQLPLDGVSVAETWGPQRLRSDYSGACLQLFNSSGTAASEDVGFYGNDLDAELAASQIADGYDKVKILYGQKGVSNFRQSTYANAPLLILDGTPSHRPVIRFTNAGTSNQHMLADAHALLNDIFSASGPKSFAIHAKLNSLGGSNLGHFWSKGVTAFRCHNATTIRLIRDFFGPSSTNVDGVFGVNNSAVGVWQAITASYDDTSTSNIMIAHINGVQQNGGAAATTPQGTAQSDAATQLKLGNNSGGTIGMDGDIASFAWGVAA